MKIDGVQPHNIYTSFSKSEKAEQTHSDQPAGADRVEISAEAASRSEAGRLSGQIQDDSDNGTVREERLAAIKKQVQDGSYQVPAEKVAGSILGGRIDRKA